MQIVLAAILALIAIALVFAAIEALHHAFAIQEYGLRQYRCPVCGKRCYGMRARRHTNEPWGPWRSSCCAAELTTGKPPFRVP